MLLPPPQRPPPNSTSVELSRREVDLLSSAQDCLTAVPGVTKVRPRSPTVPKDNKFVLEERAAAREAARRAVKEKAARKAKGVAKQMVRRRKTAKRAAEYPMGLFHSATKLGWLTLRRNAMARVLPRKSFRVAR